MNLQKLIFTNNACYKAGRTITVKGIMVHSTGVNNPNLRRYVGPDDGLLGKNQYNNHWNQDKPDARQVCVHGFIGKLADGSIATYQTLPWNHRGWHGGSGTKGSVNDTHIGFEICEDGLTDAVYFRKVFNEAVELCAYLCKAYDLDPMKDGVIIGHYEGYTRGIASNHGDPKNWFPKHGESMDTFRAAVKKGLEAAAPSDPAPKADEYYRVRTAWADSKTQKGAYKVMNNAKKCADDNPGYSVFDPKGALVYTGKNTAAPAAPAPAPSGIIESGSLVAFKGGTKNYYPGGAAIPPWVISDYNHLVTQVTSGGKAVVKGGKVCVLLGKKIHKKTGKEEAGINTWADMDVLEVVGAATASAFVAYTVKVTTDILNIRKGPGTDTAIVGAIKDKGVYTIVDEANGPGAAKWGKLKSGAGWISLDYTKKQ